MWALGPYRLDPASFALSRGGHPIALQPRPLDLLLYLIARRDQVSSREQILSEVWGGVTVSEGALSTAVYELRAAIGDLERTGQERWVETVRGRGFRFRGPAEWIAGESAPKASPPFVGRAGLLGSLRHDVRRLESAHGGLRVIEGVAGMGKTRLVEETLQDPSAATVHTVYCEPGGPPYWPWTQLVRSLSRQRREEGTDDSAWLLEAPDEDEGASFRFERLDRMLQVLSTASASGPLVLVIEDIHWADVQSLALLESVGRQLASLPVLILATHRVGEEAGDPVAAWTGTPQIQRIRLEPLTAMDLYYLLGSLVGQSPSPEFVGWIERHSGGVPLLVRELAEHVDPDVTTFPDVPQLAKLMLAKRFDGLSKETRLAIAVAALCGERFDVPLVEAAAEGLLALDRAWIRDGVANDILVPDARQPLRFSFGHALIRDAARGTLGAEEAAEWHGRLARALEQQHPEPRGDVVSQIAHHAAASALIEDDLERPLRYALLAARGAADVFAWEDVRVHSGHALGWMHYLPPGAVRDDREIEAALLRCAGITPYSGHVEETHALLDRIEPMLARSRDEKARALALGFRFANARSLGDFGAALACAEDLESVHGLGAVADCWRLGVASLAGDLAAAIAAPTAEGSLATDARFIEYARLCGRDPEVDRLGLSAFASFFLGHDADALSRAGRAVRWAEDRGDARSMIWALFLRCMLHDMRRDWSALAERAPEVDEQGTRHGVTAWSGAGTALAAWANTRLNPPPVYYGGPFASIWLDRGQASNVSIRTVLIGLSSRIYTHSGDLAGAENAARVGLDACERTDERFMAPELERLLGGALAARGEKRAASEARERALEVARAQGNVVAELRTLCDRIEAGAAEPGDRERLRALQEPSEADFGPHERALLERLS